MEITSFAPEEGFWEAKLLYPDTYTQTQILPHYATRTAFIRTQIALEVKAS